MNALFGPNIGRLEDSMRFRVARQSVLSANVANADTPGYRRVDLRFDELLGDAFARLTTTDPKHFTSAGSADNGYALERGPRGPRPDGNGVDLDRELIHVARNAGTFRQHAEALSRLLSLRRVAVTGEPR